MLVCCGFISCLLQIADVGGADGFAHLLAKLAERLTDSGQATPAASRAGSAFKTVLSYCLDRPHLRAATVEGLSRNGLEQVSAARLLDLASELQLNSDQQACFGLALLTAESQLWQRSGVLDTLCRSCSALPDMCPHGLVGSLGATRPDLPLQNHTVCMPCRQRSP
jgi:hypothetical protein